MEFRITSKQNDFFIHLYSVTTLHSLSLLRNDSTSYRCLSTPYNNEQGQDNKNITSKIAQNKLKRKRHMVKAAMPKKKILRNGL